jgi:phosphoribosyl-dephospho-CoA transferase
VGFQLKKLMTWMAHDLLEISGLSDLVDGEKKNFKCGRTQADSPEEQCPCWVERSLQEAPFVVVRRAESFDDLIPVGVRGPSRKQRFAVYLAPESVRDRITPEHLLAGRGWLDNARREEIPALRVLPGIEKKLARFQLSYGPTGSIGFELASGLATTTFASDLDLLIRVPQRLPMSLAQELIAIFSTIPCRVDPQLETPRGAVALTEYANGQRPILLRESSGPVLVDDPWV